MDLYKKEFISKMISVPSVGGVPEEGAPYGHFPKEALDVFLAKASEEGFSTGILGDRVGWCEIGSGSRLIGIVCHLDVVPEGEGWESDPFEAVYKDDNIYGRGIIDDKGPAMASFFAMKELKDSGLIPSGTRIRLILGTDEERTCSCVEYYDANGEIPDIAITPDAEFPVIYAEKGILHVNITDPAGSPAGFSAYGGQAANMVAPSAFASFGDKRVDAAGKMAHASKPELGINAIGLLPFLIKEAGCFPHSSLIDFIEKYDPSSLCNITDDSGSLTSNIGILRMGPDEAYMTIDIRYPVTASMQDIFDNISSQAEALGLKAGIASHMGPISMDKDSEVVKALTSVWEDHMSDFDNFREEYREIYSSPLAIGGGTYARHMRNTIAFGIQTPWMEDQCHQANEHISENDLEQCIKVIKDAVLRLSALKHI